MDILTNTFTREKSWYILRSLKDWLLLLPESQFEKLDRSLNRFSLQMIDRISRSEANLTMRGCERTFSIGRTAAERVSSLMRNLGR